MGRRAVALIFVFLLIAPPGWCATYYVDATLGDDGYTGLYGVYSGGTDGPWQTLAYAQSNVSDNDTILLKRDESWHESLTIPVNGLTVDAYGSGAKPLLTGAEAVTTWTVYSGNIYQAAFSGTVYQLIEDGTWALIAHEPEGSYLQTDSAGSGFTLYDTPENIAAADIPGSDLHLRLQDWYMLGYRVQSYSAGVLTLLDDGRTGPSAPSGKNYYLCNQLAFLDTAGEWYANGSTLYYYTSDGADPDTHTMLAATLRKGIYAYNKSNLTLQNIAIQYFGAFGIHLIDCENPTLSAVDVDTIGSHLYDATGDGTLPERTNMAVYLDGRGDLNSEGGSISGGTISNSQSDGIWLQDQDSVTIDNVTITQMGMHGADDYALRGHGPTGMSGIVIHDSSGVSVTNSTVSYTAYNGVNVSYGANVAVGASGNGNTFNYTMQRLSDGAAIYYVGYTTDGGGIVDNRISHVGTDHTVVRAQQGIYLDNAADALNVTLNDIEFAPRCLMLHSASNITLTQNECRDVAEGFWTNSDTYSASPDSAGSITFTNNRLYTLGVGYVVRMSDLHGQDPYVRGLFTTSDNNTYWPDGAAAFRIDMGDDGYWSPLETWEENLAGWRSVSGDPLEANLDSGELDTNSIIQQASAGEPTGQHAGAITNSGTGRFGFGFGRLQ